MLIQPFYLLTFFDTFFGRPLRGVAAKSWSCLWDIPSIPEFSEWSFSGSCSAIAIAFC